MEYAEDLQMDSQSPQKRMGGRTSFTFRPDLKIMKKTVDCLEKL